MILVTGATGKIGSEVVRLLRARGAAVRALVRNPDKAKGWQGVEIAVGDFDDRESIDAAMKDVRALFLLSNANPKQEGALIEAAQRARVKKVVKVSSLGASPDSPVTLARGHAAVEAQLQASGMAWTLLRPGMFAQNFLGFAPSIRATGSFSGSYGTGRVAPIDVRDIAEVAALALTHEGHEGKTYALTGPAAIDHAEAAASISAALGKPVRYVDQPVEVTRAALTERMGPVGAPAWLIEDLLGMQAFTAQGKGATVTHDFEQVTGHPARTFDDFARDHADAFR